MKHPIDRQRLAKLATSGLFVSVLASQVLQAEVDKGFNCVLGEESGEVHALVKQADGKILIGGMFDSVKGVRRYALARLLPSGAVDTSFDAGIISGNVYAIAPQANGQFLIGGNFSSINGTAHAGLARLNADGSLDQSFNPSIPGTVSTVAVQTDGAIVVGGIFSTVNGTTRGRLARLLPGGALDTGFNNGTGLSGGNRWVNAIAIQNDGKILVGGNYTKFNGVNRKNLARLNPDGTLDVNFDPLDQIYLDVFSILPETSGKIVVTGYKYCRRLMPDGKSLDPTFIEPDTGIGADAAEVHAVAALPDGGYVMGGKFYRVGNHYRLNAVAFGTNTYVAVGDAVFYAADDRYDLLKLTGQTGLLASPLTGIAFGDGTFVEVGRTETIRTSHDLSAWATVPSGVPQGFNSVTYANNLFLAVGSGGTIRMSSDDGATWQTPANSTTNTDLYAAAGDGSHWVAVGGRPGSGIILYSDNGSLWNVATNAGTNILYGATYGNGVFVAVGENSAILSSTNGQVWQQQTNSYTNTLYSIAAGGGTFVAVGAAGQILRSPTGSGWTNGYNYSTLAPWAPLRGITYASGKFLVVGDLGTVLVADPTYAPPSLYFFDRTLADQYMIGAAVLDNNGLVRTNFVSGIRDLLSNYPEVVYTLAPETNGVFVAGNWVQVTLTNLPGGSIVWTNSCDLALLKMDGTLNPTFDVGMGVGGASSPSAIVVQPDGKILLGGDFSSVDGVARNRIARVNADGSLDTSFDPGTGADRRVYSLAVHANGKIVAGGIFNVMGAYYRRPVARLNSDGSVDTTFDPGIGLAFNDIISALVIQPDEKVIVNGSSKRILRLNSDGKTDTSFMTNVGVGVKGGGGVNSIALQPDGSIVVGGSFTNFNNTPANRLARLLPSGTNDLVFLSAIGSGADSDVNVVAIQTNGLAPGFSILIGGSFTNFNGSAHAWLARLNDGGVLDGGFATNAFTQPSINFIVPAWDTTASDTLIYLGGRFTNVSGFTRMYVARVNSSGQLDAAFNSGLGPDAYPTALAVPPDLKALIGGAFRTVENGPWADIARITAGSAGGVLVAWRNAHFTSAELANPAISGDGADPDHDGLVNLVEYALNLDPKVSLRSGLPTASVQVNPADGKRYAVLTYHRLIGSPGVLYFLEVSDNLGASVWDSTASRFEEFSVVSDGNGVTETVNARIKPAVGDLPSAFVRLRIRGQ